MDDNINFGDENEEAIQIDDGGNDNSYDGGGVNNNPFMNNDVQPQDLNQPYADSPAP